MRVVYCVFVFYQGEITHLTKLFLLCILLVYRVLLYPFCYPYLSVFIHFYIVSPQPDHDLLE